MIALPELKGPTLNRSLIGERSQNEATILVNVVFLKKVLTTIKREICAVDEIFMEGVALGVDVIDFITVLAINDEENMRQRVGRVRIIVTRDCIELLARADRRQRTNAGRLRFNFR